MDPSLDSRTTVLTLLYAPATWSHLAEVVRATPWRLLLVDAHGVPVLPPAHPTGLDFLPNSPAPTRRAAPLDVTVAYEQFTRALSERQVMQLWEPTVDGDLLWMIVPIWTGAEAVGALLVGGLPGGAVPLADGLGTLGERAERLMALAAPLLDLSIQAQRAQTTLRAGYGVQLERYAALQQLSTVVAASRELEPITTAVLVETRRLFEADRAAIFLRQADDSLRCTAVLNLSPTYIEAVDRLYGQGAGGRAQATLDIVYVADAQEDQVMGPLRQLARNEGFHSLIVVPFVRMGEAIGALALYHDTLHSYTSDDYMALITFANQVAGAIETARLFNESQRQVQRLIYLAEAGRLLNASLEMEPVFPVVARAVAHLADGGCGIYLAQADSPMLDLRIYYDPSADQARRRAYLAEHLPAIEKGPIGEVAAGAVTQMVTLGTAAAAADPYLVAFGSHTYLAVPLRVQERVIGALVLWLFAGHANLTPDDITLSEALADRAAVALENARLYERERRAQRAKDAFLSSVSHELRTPLTAILGYSQLIAKRLSDTPEQTTLLSQMQTIRGQAERLHRLIETILDISRIEQGQLTLQVEWIDLEPLIEAVVTRVRALVRPSIAFELSFPPDLAAIQGDPIRLEQVFYHLLSNAAKYSPTRGTVQISVRQRADEVYVEICDDGPGLRSMDAAQLFERYYQADTPPNRAGGLGLGLYVSRAIIEHHGGSIGVQSAASGGALFRVMLPGGRQGP